MKNDYIDFIEPTPKLSSKKCKVYALILRIFLQYSIYIFTLSAWYIYDYFIAIATLILSYIIIGILRAKIRNSVIPINQREYQYNDQAIADWYIAKEVCLEE